MKFVPGYDYDFFVSYASLDNDQFGWVHTLISNLTSGVGLAGKLGRREMFEYWIDEQALRGNHEVDNHIPEQARRSALFVAVLSPSYAASTFCQLELQAFLENSGADLERLFVIYKEPLIEGRQKMPEAFARLRKYDFWENDEHKKPRTLGWPQPLKDNPADRPYYNLVGDLSEDMAKKLVDLRAAAAKMQDEKKDQERITVAPKATVLLAESTDGLMRKREDVRRYLEQAGIDIMPVGSYYGLGRGDYEKTFLKDLSNSAAFVQLLGPELGRCLTDFPDGFGWFQYQLAKDGQRPILQWRSPDLRDLQGVEDKQKRLLDMADAMPLEDFKKKIVTALSSNDSPKVQRPSFIFINCDAVDTDSADAVGDHLGGHMDWERPLYEDKPKAQQLEEEIESGVIGCDGLFIVFGRTGPNWVRQQLQLYRKLRPRRVKEPSVLAVVQTGPERKELGGIGVAGLKIIGLDEVSSIVKSAST
ncbi:MAG: toll/interleukin-1 receptor domain-containing protein [Xanthobacteraceae bacterium]